MSEFNHQEAYYSKSNPEYHNRLISLQQKYEESHNLGIVAKEFNITRERVRQLLQDGKRLKFFDYQTREERMQYVSRIVTRQQILDAIEKNKSRKMIMKELKITLSELKKLSIQYEITKSLYIEHRLIGRKHLVLQEYLKAVDTLGHHLTTTELISNKGYCNLWRKIDRLWGNIDHFRQDYNIVLHNPDLNMMHLANHYYGVKRLLRIIDFLKAQKSPLTLKMVVQAGLLSYPRAQVHFGNLKKLGILSCQGKLGNYALNHQNIYKITDDLYETAKKIGNKAYILDKS